MEKTYKSEAKMIRRISFSARMTFKHRKFFLDVQPYIVSISMVIAMYFLSDFMIPVHKMLGWIFFSIIAIPMTLLIVFMLDILPKFSDVDDYAEHHIREYLTDHSWRNVYVLLKKQRFPEQIEKVLFRVLFRKINRIAKSSEIKAWIVEDGYFERDDQTRRFHRIKNPLKKRQEKKKNKAKK